MTEIVFPFDAQKEFEKAVKHQTLPKNDFLKQAILLRLLEEFKEERIYLEDEVNEIVKRFFTDFTMVRRELINFGYMQRKPLTQEYWVMKRVLTDEDIRNNTILRRHAKPYKVLDEDKDALNRLE